MQSAGHAYSREELERMKRADIQKLCKDYGVKANMKTESLIELLLDTIHSNMSPLVPPPRPQPHTSPPVARRVSTRARTTSRTSSMKSRGSSGSSMVVHSADDEQSQAAQYDNVSINTESTFLPSVDRPRKAKDTQYRLGVGRPVGAGGSGARAVTRTLSVSKGKRGRVSRSVKLVEETIDEEVETGAITEEMASVTKATEPRPSLPSGDDSDVVSRIDRLETLLREANFRQHFENLKDVPAQIMWLKSSLQQREGDIAHLRGELQACRVEVMVLRGEAAKIPLLESQVKLLKDKLHAGTPSHNSPTKTTMMRRVSIPLGESNTNATSSKTPPDQPHILVDSPQTSKIRISPRPGPTATALGKRHRDSNSSNISGVVEVKETEGLSEKDLAKRVLKPSRKRTKTMSSEERNLRLEEVDTIPDPEHQIAEQEVSEDSATPSAASSGPSTMPPVGTPPPTKHLPDYFVDSLNAAVDPADKEHGRYATEDGLFGFSFHNAASSTPRDDVFNYFDAPFSPGSAINAGASRLNGGNNAGLHPFVFGSRRISGSTTRPLTPTRISGHDRFSSNFQSSYAHADQFIGSPLGTLDDNEFPMQFDQGDAGFMRRDAPGVIPAPVPLALGLGLGTAASGTIRDETPARPTPRTMYGTELQNDTRFGDFGRDGIASNSTANFWMSGGMF